MLEPAPPNTRLGMHVLGPEHLRSMLKIIGCSPKARCAVEVMFPSSSGSGPSHEAALLTVSPTFSRIDDASYSASESDDFPIVPPNFTLEVFVRIAIQPLEEARHTNV
jgi:hypothetical protein